jgi:AraC-like DNA-binding protein
MEWTECISKAISYIEDNITEELTIQDIAKQAMLSPFYFQKGFAMLCGFTVGEYIKKRRLTLAGSEFVSTDRNKNYKYCEWIQRYQWRYRCIHFFIAPVTSISL